MQIRKILLSIFLVLSLMLVATSCANRESYQITFNSNGGSLVESQTVYHDQKVTRPADPAKEGHTFVDWYSDEALVTVYDFNARVRKAFTLYAKWNVNQYSISYVTNVEGYELKTGTLGFGSKITAPKVDEEKFVVEGHVFDGWYLDAEYTKALTEDSKMAASDVTLYAKWAKEDHKVTFIVDDLTYKVVDVKYGDSLPTVDVPTKVGYTFAGWLLNKTDSETISSDYVITKSVTVYSKWNVNQYSITFDSNGGSEVAAQTYDFNSKLTAPQAPTKEGYVLEGWYLNDVYFNFNENKMPANNITLVAKWKAASYNVTFDTKGGSAITSAKVEFNTKVTKPTDPTKTGYTFDGWLLDDEAYDFDTLMPASNITLIANWVANEYKINFNANNGTDSSVSIDAKYDQNVTAPDFDTLNFVNKGWSFVGWNTDKNGNGTSYVDLANLTNISTGEDVTLYAIWSQNTYTLTIKVDGQDDIVRTGLHYGDTIEAVANPDREDFNGWLVGDDEWSFTNATMPDHDLVIIADFAGQVKITFYMSEDDSIANIYTALTGYEERDIIMPANPTKEGYKFLGWYTDKTLSTPFTATKYSTEKNTPVYAKWEIETVVIKFNGNGSTAGVMDAQSIVYNSNTPLTSNSFEKEGHSFLGWSTTATGEVEYADGYNKNVISSGEITLYAVWKVNQYTITFNTDSDESAINPITQNYGTSVTKPTDPTKYGYEFKGWLLNNEDYAFNTMPSEDITLTAKWQANKYTLTLELEFDKDTPSANSYKTETVEVDIYYGDKIIDTKIGDSTRYGNTFGDSWYIDSTYQTKYTYDDASIVEGNITLYGFYSVNTYTVRFLANDNEATEPLYTIENVKFGSALTFADCVLNITQAEANAFETLYKNIEDVIKANLAGNDAALYQALGILVTTIASNEGIYQTSSLLNAYINYASGPNYYYSITSLDTNQWQEFYGIAKGLYDGKQALVNSYKIDNGNNTYSYEPSRKGYFFDNWYLGTDTVNADGQANVAYTGTVPASAYDGNGLVVNVIARWGALQAVDDLAKKEDTTNTIIWTQISDSQFEIDPTDERVEISYLLYNVDSKNNLTLLDTIAHTEDNKVMVYEFMKNPVYENDELIEKGTFSAPGTYNLVVISQAQVIKTAEDGTESVIRTYQSNLTESEIIPFTVVVDPDNVNIKDSGDYYSVDENGTFYFFTNMEYTFTEAGEFALVNPNDSIYASVSGKTIITTNIPTIKDKDSTGDENASYFEFTNTYYDADDVPHSTTYKAIVLPYVSQFTLGKDLMNFQEANTSSDVFRGKNATYTIGRFDEKDTALADLYTSDEKLFEYKDNGYRFDLNILTTGGMSIDPTDFGGYLVYNFYIKENSTYTPIDKEFIKDGSYGKYHSDKEYWSFKVNGEYKVEISINPLYVAPIQIKENIIKTQTFYFTVDNSINVYTNEQFKAVFKNTSIGNDVNNSAVTRGISLHSNIEAKLDDNQYYGVDSSNPLTNPANIDTDDGELKLDKVGNSPINVTNNNLLAFYDRPNYASGNVYERISNVDLNETYNINGNCFSIDGSHLPFVNIHSRGNASFVTGYEIPKNSVSIIRYIVTSDSSTVGRSKLVVNDLRIVGNSTKPTLDESSENFQSSIQLMNRNAGGYQGINSGYGSTIEVNNCVITKAVVGIAPYARTTLVLTDSKVSDCWFNGIYGDRNRHITITNSELRDFGGAAIHLEDNDSLVKKYTDGRPDEYLSTVTSDDPATITIDTASILENYVSGDEGFFKAYSMEFMVMKLKSEFESGVKDNGWTMLKDYIDPVTQLPSTKVNFVMLLGYKGDSPEKELTEYSTSEYKVYGAGQNMMRLGFKSAILDEDGNPTFNEDGTQKFAPVMTDGLNGYSYLSGQNTTHTDSAILNAIRGKDVVVLAGAQNNPSTFKGLLVVAQEVPGFGGSVIVAGVRGNQVKD